MTALSSVAYDTAANAPLTATLPGVVNADGTATVAFAAAAGGVVKASSGRLCAVLVTTTGTADAVFYDNPSAASGTIIGLVPASAAKGAYPIHFPAATGIYYAGGAGAPAVTVSYA